MHAHLIYFYLLFIFFLTSNMTYDRLQYQNTSLTAAHFTETLKRQVSAMLFILCVVFFRVCMLYADI